MIAVVTQNMRLRHLVLLSLTLFAFPCLPAINAQADAEVTAVQVDGVQSGAQSADSTDALSPYSIIASAELGVRGTRVRGNENKYRSDLNYQPGFRIFDSSFFMKARDGKGKPFDTLAVSSTGWNADPNRSFHLTAIKSGLYQFDASIRHANYFNALSNLALGQHISDNKRLLGAFDLKLLPLNRRVKFYLGFAPERRSGFQQSTFTYFQDEFPLAGRLQQRANDWHAGVSLNFLGVDLSIMQGARFFRDDTTYTINSPQAGSETTGNSALNTYQRDMPIVGRADFTRVTLHSLIAKRVDFSGRLIYSNATDRFNFVERISGRDLAGNTIVRDLYTATGDVKRPNTVGDVGLTLFVTEKLKLSNTFRVNSSRIDGGEDFIRELTRVRTNGSPLPVVLSLTSSFRTSRYLQFVDTAEADFQFNPHYAVHGGFRRTDRHIEFDRLQTATDGPPVQFGSFGSRTNAAFGGFKLRPVRDWTVYFDMEHGRASNAFVRLNSLRYTNTRLRTTFQPIDKVTVNLALITRDNALPTVTEENPAHDFSVSSKSRSYTASVSWIPNERISVDAGYTFQHLTSAAAVLFFISSQQTLGQSDYFVRDGFAFGTVQARLHKRVNLFTSYRISRDGGRSSLFDSVNNIFIGSYPYSFQSTEAKLAFQLSKRVDWNFGYQFYNFADGLRGSNQGYRAHLPYTSLRISIGGSEK